MVDLLNNTLIKHYSDTATDVNEMLSNTSLEIPKDLAELENDPEAIGKIIDAASYLRDYVRKLDGVASVLAEREGECGP